MSVVSGDQIRKVSSHPAFECISSDDLCTLRGNINIHHWDKRNTMFQIQRKKYLHIYIAFAFASLGISGSLQLILHHSKQNENSGVSVLCVRESIPCGTS